MIIDKIKIRCASLSFAGLLLAAFLLLPYQTTNATTNDSSKSPTAPTLEKESQNRPDGPAQMDGRPRQNDTPRLFAQQDTGKGGRHDGRRLQQEMHKRQESQGNRRRHLEQFRMLKLLELLDLNEDQELKFMSGFRQVRKQQEQMNQKKAVLLDRLGTGLHEETLKDDDILELIDGIAKIDSQKNQLVTAFLSESEKYLTVQQMGKMVLFQERFEYEMLDQVRAFRERNRSEFEDSDSGEGSN